MKYMDIKEFRDLGLLQEINRLFLHPMGLALEVRIGADGVERLGGIWDYRDDPEGILFPESVIDLDHIETVFNMRYSKVKHRGTDKGCDSNGIQWPKK
jgi:hypothetical protein